MKDRKKPSKWVTAAAAIVAVAAVYLAFDIGRGTYYNNLGATHMAEGEYDKAIECFTRALKARRKSPEAHCNRGTAYSEKGEHDKAVADLSKAIELNPEFADAYYNRAVVHYQMKQYEKSWQDLDKAQELGYGIERDLLEALHEVSPRDGAPY